MKKWCLLIIVLLTMVTAVYFIGDFYATSDQLYNDYADTGNIHDYSREDFYTEYLDVVAENQSGSGDNSLTNSILGNSGMLTGTSGDWYTSISPNTSAGSQTSEVFVKSTNPGNAAFPNIYVYDSLPWKADDVTYFFNIRKAREDVWELYDKAGIQHVNGSSLVISSVVHKGGEITYDGQYSANIDGINAVGIGVYPAMWKNYYMDYAMAPMTTDSLSANWKYKMAIVVVDKGEDIDDQQKWKYIPATRVSYKAHTFYGGVLQTNVKLNSADGNILMSTNNSGASFIVYKNVAEIGKDEGSIIGALKDIESQAAHAQGKWWNNYLEMYNIGGANVNNICSSYDFVGFIIYGGTFLNMNQEGCYEK